MAKFGAAWQSWCGVAKLGCGVAKLVRRGKVGVRRGKVGAVRQSWCGVAKFWCGVAKLVTLRLAERQARVRFSARHHREVFPTELTSDDDMERGLGEWRRINVLNECD